MISQALFSKAQHALVGGVNSPVRSFSGVGGEPLFFHSAQGAILEDVDGREYIDYVGSWGPMIMGHSHPDVINAVQLQSQRALSFGAPCELEIQLAERIRQLMPHQELVRFVSSGTEATMTAIRLARGYTKRNKILKFSGCYHGHSDALLVKAGSGAQTLGVPTSAGVPIGVAEDTLTVDFNDQESVVNLFEEYGAALACVIIEPIAGNMGFVLPEPGFLNLLRQLCDQYQSVLIFDEVMTGFRVALGGAQSLYDIQPDLTTLGKIIGGGLPVGAVSGRRDIMEFLAPIGPVYQAGTLSGSPMAMAAGLATLDCLKEPGVFQHITEMTQALVEGLLLIANKRRISLTANSVGGMFGFCFTEKEQVTCLQDVVDSDLERFKQFYHKALNAGVYFAPSAYEAGFVSHAHQLIHIQTTLEKLDSIFADL